MGDVLVNYRRAEIQLSIDPIAMCEDKKYRETNMNVLMTFVCALLNTTGGLIRIHFTEKVSEKSQMKLFVRMVEQRLLDLITCLALAESMVEMSCGNFLEMRLRKSDSIFTLCYNLYLPSESQVMLVPQSEPIENVRRIISETRSTPVKRIRRTTQHRYIEGTQLHEGGESKVVAYKYLKEKASKCITIADRIVGKSNKFSHYVSAFANHMGGKIYYGILDNGQVQGEQITGADQVHIINKVTKAINSMIWPGKLERGKHWDINFYEVENASGERVDSKYVVVISVEPYPGGVFVKTPESYYLQENELKQMSFDHWKSLILDDALYIPRNISRVTTWSSLSNRKTYQALTLKLVHLRNQGNTADFNKLIEKIGSSDNISALVATSERAAFELKHRNMAEVRGLVRTFGEKLKECPDSNMFEVQRHYLESRMEEAEGQFDKSYEIAMEGISHTQMMQPEYMTIWLYTHAATMASILSSMCEDQKKQRSYHKEAKEIIELAMRDVRALQEDTEGDMCDLLQKLKICKTSIYLGCPFTGDTVDEHNISLADFQKANSSLGNMLLPPKVPTPFREIQFLLAQSDLLFRHSQFSLSKGTESYRYLEYAWKMVDRAHDFTKKYGFDETSQHVEKRKARLAENLVCLALQRKKTASKPKLDSQI